MAGVRIERDGLGERELAADSPIGINTLRAVDNFPLGAGVLGDRPPYLRRLIQVKQAAARANRAVGALPDDIAAAIDRGCRRVLDELDPPADRPDRTLPPPAELFPVDVLEGSGGTSTNMNLNEVLANLALDELGVARGTYERVHPNDHVNLGQSTNDVVPTALGLAVFDGCRTLITELERLAEVLTERRDRWADVLRTGRTCLQPAQPMTLGQAFGGYGAAVARAAAEIDRASSALLAVPLGATAIGTGLGAADGYRGRVISELASITGLAVRSTPDRFDGEQNADTAARVSAQLRTAADLLAKIATDIVLLSSAPDGRPELTIPAAQAGSSLMPGKVNPVIPMTVQQVSYVVFGNDASVALAAANGQLELNHFEPVIARCLLDSLGLLTAVTERFRAACIEGIEPDVDRSRRNLLGSPAIATALADRLGYRAAAALVRRSETEGRALLDLAVDEGLIPPDGVDDFLLAAAAGPADRPTGEPSTS